MADFAQWPCSPPSPEIGAPEPPVPEAINANLIAPAAKMAPSIDGRVLVPRVPTPVSSNSRRW
ncbi:MAG: hypothetical protein QOD10_5862 [Mycobacterium sp.]|jgi:hypothetical protein|nr:hypothetical protein [Mycobacterium sp.]